MAVGEYLPKVMITNERTTRDALQAEQEKGLTLLHFWASYDAESRAENLDYSKFTSDKGVETLNYQAVSLDVDADVFEQTLAFDGVESDEQLLTDLSKRRELMTLCKLNEGLHSFLLDGSGKILAVDPTTAELAKFVRN